MSDVRLDEAVEAIVECPVCGLRSYWLQVGTAHELPGSRFHIRTASGDEVSEGIECPGSPVTVRLLRVAALPAGVYVSDGQGNVTPGEDVAAVLRQILTMVTLPITQRRGVSDARLDAIRNATERALAAVSATDTESDE